MKNAARNKTGIRYLWFSLSFLAVAASRGDMFEDRPTTAEMNQLIEQGALIQRAVSERGFTGGKAGASGLPYCGTWQAFFRSMQISLENMANQYVDTANGPFNTENTEIRYYTLATWRAAAGINTKGFTRVTTNGITQFGLIQPGDRRGAWIYQELRRGYHLLRWTTVPITWSAKGRRNYRTGSASAPFSMNHIYRGLKPNAENSFIARCTTADVPARC